VAIAVPLTVLVYLFAPSKEGRSYLLLRRLPSEGGFWQGITGSVEPGETLEVTARRELIEETGLVPFRLQPVHFSYTFVPRGLREAGRTPHRITEHVFVAGTAERREPQMDSHEHDSWQWLSFPEAISLLSWPDNVEALRRSEAVAALWSPPPAPSEFEACQLDGADPAAETGIE
jgi:8-oxo-dGTP pyrophosphatase MutT (NUDIX family)